MKSIILTFSVWILLMALQPLMGQFYNTGTAPASVHWSQINTPHFRIVFPSEIDDVARRFAYEMELYKPSVEAGLQHSVKRFPIILYNTSVRSNGYVAWTPRRMELVVTPPQDSYAQDWMSQLVLHEYRHTVQLDKINQGLTKILYFATGEIAAGSIVSMIPSWYYEGDAVSNETSMSNSGRGRSAGFAMPLRTHLLQDERLFSYDKAVFGSYRNFVPDRYNYGYEMVQYGNNRFGPELWSGAIDFTARKPYMIWPFTFYLKKSIKLNKAQYYAQTMDSLKKEYILADRKGLFINYKPWNAPREKEFISYKLPMDIGNGRIATLKSGFGLTTRFVVIDTTSAEKELLTTGYTMGLKADYYGNRIIWDELVSDPRWERRDYSEIVSFDLNTGERNVLAKRTRYFSPDFSRDGNQIAVAETDLRNRHFITVIDAFSGDVIYKIAAPDNHQIQFPTWINKEEILCIAVTDTLKKLMVFNLQNNSWQSFSVYPIIDISEPLKYKQYIFIRGSYEGIENIFALNSSDLNLYKITSSRFGAFGPSISADSTSLFFSNYSSNGFDIASVQLEPSSWKLVSRGKNSDYRTDADPAYNPAGYSYTDTLLYMTPETVPYHKFLHGYRPHSWTPFYTDVSALVNQLKEIPIYPGFMLFSQNLLSTVTSSIGYRFDNGTQAVFPSITWHGWYPVIELSGQLGGTTHSLPLADSILIPDRAIDYYDVKVKITIPLVFDRGRVITSLQPGIDMESSGTWYQQNNRLYQGIHYLNYNLLFFRYQRLAYQDLYPRLGHFIDAVHTQTPGDEAQFGSMTSLRYGLFLPGAAKHHHLFLEGGLQWQQTEKYYIPISRVSFPRGYQAEATHRLMSLKMNYSFTVACPDLSLGPVIYIKRLRANVFYDMARSDKKIKYPSATITNTKYLKSYGAELVSEMHIIRFIFPITAGIRLGYIPESRKTFTELIFGIKTNVF